MAFFIKKIHDIIDLAIDQGISNYFSRDQIDQAIDQAQMTLFREILKEYPKTKYIRNELRPFQGSTNITIVGASGSLPSDFEHEIEAHSTTGGVKYPIKFIEDGIFRRRVLDPVDPPSETNVFAHIYNTSGPMMEVSPQVSPVQLSYFKRPTRPVYGTTASSTGSNPQYLFTETGSTDLRWSETLYDLLIERTLKILGLGMKDGLIYRAGEQIPKKDSIV